MIGGIEKRPDHQIRPDLLKKTQPFWVIGAIWISTRRF